MLRIRFAFFAELLDVVTRNSTNGNELLYFKVAFLRCFYFVLLIILMLVVVEKSDVQRRVRSAQNFKLCVKKWPVNCLDLDHRSNGA